LLRPTDDLRPRDAWTQQIQDSLVNDGRYAAALGGTPQARSEALLKGGLKIYATLDQTAQANAERAIDSVIGGVHDSGLTASLVAMDPNTGAVKAMIPGTHFNTSQYNIATHPYCRWVRRGRS
jgi:membrane peptidoglycan carboxypeptidase